MKNILSKWFKKSLALKLVLFLALSSATSVSPTAQAYSTPVAITGNSAYVDSAGSYRFSYCLNTAAYVTAGVYEAEGAYSSKIVDIFTAGEYKSDGCHTETWDTTYGRYSETGTPGSKVAPGELFYGVNAEGVDTGTGQDYVSEWITIGSWSTYRGGSTSTGNLKFLDIETENRTFNPKDGQKGKVTFITTSDSYVTLDIYDNEDDSTIIQTLADSKYFSAGEHTLKWDGRDIYGQTVDQGEYKFILTAENGMQNDVEISSFKVKFSVYSNNTEDPRLKNVFSTKDSFDPGRNEKAQIVFTLTATASVEINVYDKSGGKIDNIYDKNDRSPGTYVVEWDGVNQEGTYTYSVYAENSAGNDIANGEIKVEEDYKSGKKPNILKDKPSEIPFKPKFNNVFFYFSLDRDADVTIEIRDGKNTIATVITEQSLNEGQHKIGWDGRNDYGGYVENGTYQYKIKAENYSGSDVEKGTFTVEQTGEAKHLYGGCGNFSDVDEYYQYCTAIKWAEAEGIFNGYNDGTFQPNQPITRVEALKVILEGMDINTIDANGQALGFRDANPHSWYAGYMQTALSLGIVNGYGNGYFLPGNYISRAESLKIILEAGEVKYGINIPTKSNGNPYMDTPNDKWYISYAWFSKAYGLSGNDKYFYPDQNMTRGEMADMLYRYNKNLIGLN